MKYQAIGIAVAGTVSAGAALAAEGNPIAGEVKARDCVYCHNAKGADKYSSIPILAGQNRLYLGGQIRSLRTSAANKVSPMAVGERHHKVMEAQVAALSDADVDDIATYFSSQPCRSSGTEPPRQVPLIVNRCAVCHADEAIGDGNWVPDLNGQNPIYLRKQLTAYFNSAHNIIDRRSTGERHHRIMTRQAGIVMKRDIEPIARYFASLPCQQAGKRKED